MIYDLKARNAPPNTVEVPATLRPLIDALQAAEPHVRGDRLTLHWADHHRLRLLAHAHGCDEIRWGRITLVPSNYTPDPSII